MGKIRRLFIFAAIAGIAVVVAKKLGFMGGDDEPIEYASDPGMPGEDSADGDDDDAAN